jgi:hypothetical protein
METSTLIYYMAGSLIGLVIFYNIIKAAVRNGIREARKDAEPPVIAKGIPDVKPNEKQLELQERYNKGEITFDVYKSEWEKTSFIQP